MEKRSKIVIEHELFFNIDFSSIFHRFWEVFGEVLGTQEGPKDAQEASKRFLRGSQDALRDSQRVEKKANIRQNRATTSKIVLGSDFGVHFGGPSAAQETPRRSIRRPKRSPRDPQDAPRDPQGVTQSSKRSPRAATSV